MNCKVSSRNHLFQLTDANHFT